MEFTGYDTVLFTDKPIRRFVTAVLPEVRAKWPKALIDVAFHPMSMDGKDLSFRGLDQVLQKRKRERLVELYFLRDPGMAKFMERRGYASMKDGEGPFGISISSRFGLTFSVSKLVEVAARDRTGSVGVEDYSAWICCSRLRQVTLTTPDDPKSDSFSKWILETALKSCI